MMTPLKFYPPLSAIIRHYPPA